MQHEYDPLARLKVETAMAETENYVRLTVEQAMAMYGLDRRRAETVIECAYPPCVRIRPPKVVAIGKELSAEGLRERIAREVNELIARGGRARCGLAQDDGPSS